MPRLLYITTDPSALSVLMEGQLAYFKSVGYEVIAIAAPGPALDVVAKRDGIQVEALPMQREISPLADLRSLFSMWRLLRRLQPDIVCTATSKASLIGLTAAWINRVPVRVYRLWGLRLETARGMKRSILATAERLCALCAHRTLAISESLKNAFLQAGYTRPDKIVVVGNGSNNGIRSQHFEQTPEVRAVAQRLRCDWDIPENAPVLGYVGRFVRDKGIVELIDAFKRILSERPDAWLLLVGEFESGDPVPESYVETIKQHPRIIRPGFIELSKLAPYYGAMSVFAFPTYREGFGNVAVEAGAAELPVVTFNATGAVDAVTESTGTIVELGNSNALAMAVLRYFNDEALRVLHGKAGQARAIADFRPEPIWRALDEQFRDLLVKNKRANLAAQLLPITPLADIP
jgi:glycosyltransferase involved in cell wall biosynthesis